MSVKSKRKEAVKQVKAAATELPFQWYAEDSAGYINNHNAECTDPACTNGSGHGHESSAATIGQCRRKYVL